MALKILEPIDPASISLIHEQTSVQAAIQMFWMKWRNDLLENTTRAYCTTRQELGVLADLKHPHIVSLLGFCLSPLTLIFELAPHAALDQILAKYRRDNIKVHNMPLQKTCYQVSSFCGWDVIFIVILDCPSSRLFAQLENSLQGLEGLQIN